MTSSVLWNEVVQHWRRPVRNNQTFYISLPKRSCRKHNIDTETTLRIIAVENIFLIFPEDKLEDEVFKNRITRVLSSLLSDQNEEEENP